MQFLSHFGLFLLEVITLVIAILAVVAGIFAIAAKGKGREKGKIILTQLNDKYREQQEEMQNLILNKKELKEIHKQAKKKLKDTARYTSSTNG